jgi:Mrp family chromosome partitioning ATPase
VLPVTDALVLAPQVDGVIVVLAHGVTQLRSALQTVKQLRQAGARILGVVLNQVPSGWRGYGYYYQHYYARGKNGKRG